MSSPDAPTLTVGAIDVRMDKIDRVAYQLASRELTGGVHLCNAYTLALADEQPQLSHVLRHDTVNLPDGMPLVWLAKRRRHTGVERVYGPDLMQRTLAVGCDHGTRHFLYGSTPEVLDALQSAIAQQWPGAQVVGVESPPFRELSDDEVRASVNRAEALDADIVWVGMGTPKQDFLVHQMAANSSVSFVAIGAAFDFIAGTKPQAPRWVMSIGMEWAYRLASEPRRLWKRYLVYNWKFIRLVVRSREEQ